MAMNLRIKDWPWPPRFLRVPWDERDRLCAVFILYMAYKIKIIALILTVCHNNHIVPGISE
jgi:hypothetical protein